MGGTKLIRNGDNTYTMLWKDGSRSSFMSAGKLSQMTDRNGNRLTMTYDGDGRLPKIADDSGVFLVLSYDSNGRIARVGDHNTTLTWANFSAHSGSWSNGGDAVSSNNVYASTSTNGALHMFATFGLTGPSGGWITKVEACVEAYTLGDDDLGVKISTNGGMNWSTEQVVNLPSSDPNSLTCLDFTAHQSSWSWSLLEDPNLKVQVRYVKVGGQAAQNRLDWIVVRVTSASRFVSYAYDGSGRLTSVTDALGASERFSYGTIMDKSVDRADKVVRFVPDVSSRVKEVWTGLYNRTSASIEWEFRTYSIAFGNWANNRKATITDALGNMTEVQYDRLAGRPIQIDGPLAAIGGGDESVAMEWDGEHNAFSVTDGLGNTTLTTYDWRANSIRATDPTGNFTERTWENRDNGSVFDTLLLEERNRRGFTTAHAYDWLGNLANTTNAKGDWAERTYDAAGFLNRSRDFRGFDTWLEYDVHGRLAKVTDPTNRFTLFGYDPAGRRTTSTSPGGHTTTTAFDANDRVLRVTDPMGNFTSYEYNSRGDLTRLTDANGNSTTYAGNVTNGQRQTVTDARGNSTTFGYDLLGRLAFVTDARNHSTTYAYDQVGNRVKKVLVAQTIEYVYDADNRLTEERIEPLGWVLEHEYDGNGNLLRDSDELDNPTYYTYDAEGRLLRVEYPNRGVSCSYTYTPDGQQMSRGCSPTTYLSHDFVHGSGYSHVIGENDENGTRQARYTQGPSVDEPLSVRRAGQTYAYHRDAIGSVTLIRDPDEAVARSYRYDAYGQVTGGSGSLANPFTFTGREKDPYADLYHYRSRVYDPGVGRFLSKDPSGMANGPNLYAYAGNNPVMRRDPSGMHFQGCSGWECVHGGTIIRRNKAASKSRSPRKNREDCCPEQTQHPQPPPQPRQEHACTGASSRRASYCSC